MGEVLLRKRLINLLDAKGAHMSFFDAVADFPEKDINKKPRNVLSSFWHLIEDILEFIKNPDYKEIEWPKEYWPKRNKKAMKKDWDATIGRYEEDLSELKKIVDDKDTQFFKKIPWGGSQDVFREILLVADHTAYHVGELGILRQVAKNWGKR
jgi:hypothetical protein